ncbi:MAG: mechanosensitive ion channel family protein [Candidatus Omnitrophica bacterium]|nr:mechanosensitive ion channel family protein [Candidatus Omnitrophota bacterium]
MNTVTIFGYTMSSWIVLPVVFLLWITGLLFFKKIFFTALQKFAAKTKNNLDDIFLEAADFPLTLLIYTSGGAVVERMVPMVIDTELTNYLLIAFKAATIVAIILFLDKLINTLIHQYSDKVAVLRSTGGIARGIARILVIGLGVLILLDSFGVSITPIVASLGIGSLAVALALQPTLENFFAGIQIVLDKPFVVGQFVKLESGEEGYIHRIGWRSTWVRMLPNNVVVIPNKVIVDSRITNYYYPDKELAVLMQVGVHYMSDLEQVERVTIEVAKETLQEVTGGVKEFDPFIRYHTFGDFSINFSVIMRAHEFVDNYLIKHEFVKRLHKRYAQEGINIPYPIRAINYDQEKAFEQDKS